MDSSYNPQEIEPEWQRRWDEEGIYAAREPDDRPKFYNLEFFPYPSSEGLHVGHSRNYVPTDVLSRFMRMKGYNVLHPMGWDAFGEPTEQAAIRSGAHPRQITDRNTANFKRQMKLIGTSYDWSREIDSSHSDYYRWTQWFFLLLYRRGLAYRDTNWQWWCPSCQTTMSSHEVEGGVCWRGHGGITKKEIPAWYFKITAYADELVESLEEIDWPEKIKRMQRNWIGRSEGAEIDFRTDAGEVVPVFTTRPDTVFGATFFVLAPEHPLAAALTTEVQRAEVEAYTAQAAAQSEIERTAEGREVSGVFTGGCVINPANQERIPVWVADYVLMGYGSGAVMAVPAHDERDFAFARAYDLPIRVVVAPPDYGGGPLEAAYAGDGLMMESGEFDGTPNREGIRRVTAWLEEQGAGGARVNYRMRDWLISRQRYWGAPIPVVHCPACRIAPVPEEDLPVRLPEMDDFTPDGGGRSPLARAADWAQTACPSCGGPAERETDTMGGFACSSWYFLRFASPDYAEGPFDPEALRYWAPPDLYVGGAEHAVLHLLYSRFWIKVIADAGLVPFRESFPRLLNQGILHAADGLRMSKSRGNVITPDEVVAEYGADAFRLYVLFMAPFDQDVNWNHEGINGTRRFLNRLWRLYAQAYQTGSEAEGEDSELDRALHRTIRGVTERIESMRFNTMVSTFMTFGNALFERFQSGRWGTVSFQRALETLMVILAPAAPYIAEEIWQQTGHEESVHQQPWPEWDPQLAQESQVRLAVQLDGKLRVVIAAAEDAEEDEVRQAALELPAVQQHLDGRAVARVIFVPGKVLNIVTQPKVRG